MLGVMGVVNRIETFSTTLTTGGNKTIVVLNGEVSYSTIMNFSAQDTRWIDIVFGIGYDDDLKRACPRASTSCPAFVYDFVWIGCWLLRSTSTVASRRDSHRMQRVGDLRVNT